MQEGKLAYIIIGRGNFYNQDRKTIECPWTQTNLSSYKLHVMNDPNAKADFKHLADFANSLVATLTEPAKSRNAI